MFHNLCDYIRDELRELDRKAASGKLSMQEIEYADKLAHVKKSLLTVDAMENPEEYSYWDDGYNDGHRVRMYGAKGRKRDSMGRYAGRSYDDGMIAELHELMEKSPNEHTRRKFEEFISEMEKM